MPAMMRIIKFVLLLLALSLNGRAICASSLGETQKRLSLLEKKIQVLDANLHTKKNKQQLLNKKLANTESSIGKQVHELQNITTKLQTLSVDIARSEVTIKALLKKLSNQQHCLSQHILSRYKLGHAQPLKWFINQSQPESFSRKMHYYYYLISSRKKIVDELANTKKNLMKKQDDLNQQRVSIHSLQRSIALKKEKLIEDKKYQTILLQRLEKDIALKKNTRQTLRSNQISLHKLIQRLQKKKSQLPSRRFSSMQKKLPLPLALNKATTTPMNQGLLFSAPEGQSVQAVFPGTVIFSDWLKGYGLLLILDHGQGYMTLYAHNLSLLRKIGDVVAEGDKLAKVGHSGGLRKNGLYFEVRYKGKALPAQKWLQ
jgi:septal ring factor EnvC (AmiA/AmiB activator)